MNGYDEFLKNKLYVRDKCGFSIDHSDLNPILFDFQKDIIRWSIGSGKSAIFAGTGLGKTLMQAEFARIVSEEEKIKILILAPLAVSKQTIRIAKEKLNIDVCDAREYGPEGIINILNYDQLHNVDHKLFDGIILDESSILKNYSGKMRNDILNMFHSCKYKLACTATPAPNDYMELGNHSEFLKTMSRSEMLSMFFVHDSGDTANWRLKGHAENEYWKWVSSWGAIITKPSDLGYEDGNFKLPPLHIKNDVIKTNYKMGNGLFSVDARTLQERRMARSKTLTDRVGKCAEIVNGSNDIFLVWCDLNSESTALKKIIKDSVEVKGSDPNEHKEKAMLDFADGKIKCLITKPSICGHGMNFQVCSNQIFVGLSDSFEQYYQGVRRSWRFGQKNPVNVTIITSDIEGAVLRNIQEKEKRAEEMLTGMVGHTRRFVIENLHYGKSDRGIDAKFELILPKFLRRS